MALCSGARSTKNLFPPRKQKFCCGCLLYGKSQAWRFRDKAWKFRSMLLPCQLSPTPDEPTSPSYPVFPLSKCENLCWREDKYTRVFWISIKCGFYFNWQALFYSCTCGTSHGKNRRFFSLDLFFSFLNLIKNEIGPKNIERNKFKFTKNCTLSKSH